MTTTKRPAAVSGDANAAALSERLRIGAIIESAEGKRNPEMAAELALRTSLDPEQAKALLARAPAENPFLTAMDQVGPVGVVGSPNIAFTEDAEAAKAARLKEIRENMTAFNAANRPKRRG